MDSLRGRSTGFRYSLPLQQDWRSPRTCSAIWLWGLLLACLNASALAQNVLTTFAGTDWVFPGNGKPAVTAPLSNILNVTLDPNGRPIFADPGNAVVVRIE